MKNILFITNSLGFAGAEKMVTFISNQLSLRGHTCGIINLNAVSDYVNEHRQRHLETVTVYTISQPSEKTNKTLFRLKEIYQIAKEFHADVLIGFTAMPNFYAKLIGTALGIPSIMSERGDPERTGMGKGIKSKIVLEVINRSAGGVFQTDGAKAFYGKSLQRRGLVIPNPIFITEVIPNVAFSEREKSVVSVARLDNYQKRYDIMLDAFQRFSVKHPEYVLKLYGRGDDEEQIHNWVQEKGLEDKVLFPGLTKQPMQDICRDGMFLITSDFEGISNALLEAMAVGLPCVSTDHTPGGARLLITDHENGLLAPIGNTEALANAMCEFAENAPLAEKCGNNAKNVIHRFAPSKIIDLWENYILSITR